jgi:type IV secretion system protein VirB6
MRARLKLLVAGLVALFSTPTWAGVYSNIGTNIENALSALQSGAVGGTIALVTGLAVCFVTMSYTIQGFAIISGKADGALGEFIKKGIKFILIAMFSLSALNYNNWVVASFTEIQNGIAAAWSGQSGSPLQIVDGTLISMKNNGMTIAEAGHKLVNDSISNIFTAFLYWVTASLTWLIGLVVTLPAAIMIIVAKAMFFMLMGVGPLFIMSLMFPVISKWFEAWFSQVMVQIFTIGFLCMIVSATNRIFEGWAHSLEGTVKLLAEGSLSGTNFNIFSTLLSMAGVALVLVFIMYQAGSLAAQLAGGVASQTITLGRLASGASNAASGARNVASGAKNVASGGKSAHFDPNTGRDVTASRLEHMRAGRTNVNPAYRRALKSYREKSDYAWRKSAPAKA